MTREISITCELQSVEDAEDEKSITILGDCRRVHFSNGMYGDTSFDVEDWPAIKAEIDAMLALIRAAELNKIAEEV